MAALDQHPGDLHQGLAGQRMIGLGLDEALELGPGLLEQLAPADQVAALRRLVDQRSALPGSRATTLRSAGSPGSARSWSMNSRARS